MEILGDNRVQKEVTYPCIVSDGSGYRVKLGNKVYAPGWFTTEMFAEKEISSRLAKQRMAAEKRKKTATKRTRKT